MFTKTRFSDFISLFILLLRSQKFGYEDQVFRRHLFSHTIVTESKIMAEP